MKFDHKEYYKNNRDKIRQQHKDRYDKLREDPEAYANHLKSGRDWRKENLADNMLFQAKKRATDKGLEFDLELSDIVIPATCPVLGIKLERLDKRHAGSPSLDRIDNTKGYVKGNVRVISWRANAIKKDATVEEIRCILHYMLGEQVGRKENNKIVL